MPEGEGSSSGASTSTTSLSLSTSSKGPRLKVKDDWQDFDMWFQGQLILLEFDDKFDGKNDAVNKKTYGLIASSIGGEAATVVANANCKPNGHTAYEALKNAFDDSRYMQVCHTWVDALIGKQKAGQSMEAYLRHKRSLFSKVSRAFKDDGEKTWKYSMVVALIMGVHDEKVRDFLLLEAAKGEAKSKPVTYEQVESAAQTFADGRSRDSPPTTSPWL